MDSQLSNSNCYPGTWSRTESIKRWWHNKSSGAAHDFSSLTILLIEQNRTVWEISAKIMIFIVHHFSAITHEHLLSLAHAHPKSLAHAALYMLYVYIVCFLTPFCGSHPYLTPSYPSPPLPFINCSSGFHVLHLVLLSHQPLSHRQGKVLRYPLPFPDEAKGVDRETWDHLNGNQTKSCAQTWKWSISKTKTGWMKLT